MAKPTETKPKTFKNSRRELLARLKEIKDAVVYLSNGFTVTSTVYEPVTRTYTEQHTGAIRTYQDSNPRPRQFDEYPENNKENWSAVYAEADRLVALASSLREFAATQYHEAAARQREYAE